MPFLSVKHNKWFSTVQLACCKTFAICCTDTDCITAKTLRLLQPHFRLSQLHQCDQGMLPNRFLENSSRSFFFSYIAVLKHCHSGQVVDLTKSVGLADKTVGHQHNTLWMLDTTLCDLPLVCKMERLRKGGFQ